MITMLGAFAVSTPGGGIDVLYIFYYGVVSFLQGIFDTVLCVERALLLQEFGYFDKKAPVVHNLQSVVFILCPLVEFSSAIVCYLLFREVDDDTFPLLGPPPEDLLVVPQPQQVPEPARRPPPLQPF